MHNIKIYGKVNLKVLIVLMLVMVAIIGSLFTARQVRRSILSKMDFEAGNAAYDNKDWKVACSHYLEYLGRNPKDIEIWKKYAKANLAVRPLEGKYIMQAISAYRQIIQLGTVDEEIYKELARLYGGIGNVDDLAYISRMWMEHFPDNINAPLWLAEAFINLKKTDEAENTLKPLIVKLETQPDKKNEYVRACILMSQIASSRDSLDSSKQALELLNQAVQFAPDSVEAHAARAKFYLTIPTIQGLSSAQMLANARNDLETADKINSDNPQSLLSLTSEWIVLGEFDKAADDWNKAVNEPNEVIEDHFLDINTWYTVKFLLASEIALRKPSLIDGISLANDTLAMIQEKAFRLHILPPAIRLYIAADQIPDANTCLDEYNDLVLSLQAQASSRQEQAFLKALLAKVENKPYEVINTLSADIMIGSTYPQMYALLAEAYSQTGRDQQAVDTLTQYLKLNPDDSAMWEQLAKDYIKLQDWKNALNTAQRAEKIDPNKVSPNFCASKRVLILLFRSRVQDHRLLLTMKRKN